MSPILLLTNQASFLRMDAVLRSVLQEHSHSLTSGDVGGGGTASSASTGGAGAGRGGERDVTGYRMVWQTLPDGSRRLVRNPRWGQLAPPPLARVTPPRATAPRATAPGAAAPRATAPRAR